MSASQYCPHCGATNPAEETTCFACGQSLAASAPATTRVERAQRVLRQRYHLLRQIGAGGFGAVYQAEDNQLGNRLVAVKEMGGRGLTPEEMQEATDGFRREALLLARLSHPNLPRIYEQFEEAGHWYLVMDFIEGQTLEDYLAQRGGCLPVKEALQLAVQLTNVLGYLHTRQPPIVFRDLKPSNVIRTADGQVYLIDFGIARLFKPGQAKDTIAFGSPGYAAPEQYGKEQTTPRADVYSLGALLHQVLTGIDPADTPFRFKPLTMPRPAELSTLIERMVDLDAAKRPATMELVQHDLERMLHDAARWRIDEASLPVPMVFISSTYPATGALPVLAPVTSSWQSGVLQDGPVMLPPPPPRKKRPLGRWVFVAIVFLAACTYLSWAHPNNAQKVYGSASPATGDSTQPSAPTATPGFALHVPISAMALEQQTYDIAFGGTNGELDIWEATMDEQLYPDSGLRAISGLVWSPDGAYLAAVGDNGQVRILTAAGNPFANYSVSLPGINALAWSPDGAWLALAGTDGTLLIVDARTGAIHTNYKAGPKALLTVAWSPNGAYLAFGGAAQTVRIWKVKTGETAYVYHDDQGPVQSIAWSPDSTRIASADSVGHIDVWNALNGASTFGFWDSAQVTAIAWSPTNPYLAFGDSTGAVRVQSMEDKASFYVFNHHTGAICAVAWSNDGKRIASASHDGTMRVWDASGGTNEEWFYLP